MPLKNSTFRARLLASALVIGAFAVAVPVTFDGGLRLSTAQAQRFSIDISFDSFRDELASHGDWVYSDRWGMVWLPDAGPDFHPYYTRGRWEPTREYGWTWISDDDWGDIVFHYGRWVNDPYDGWMWIPGYVWSPGWVVWRSSDRYMGWMPLPPDDDFLRGYEDVSFRTSRFDNYDDYYGYARWYGRDYDADRFARTWIFIGIGDMGLRDYRRSAMREPRLVINVMNQTRNITNYTVVNNYIVNRSIAPQLERASGRSAPPRAAAEVLRRPQLVRNVDAGRAVERRAVQEAPRGRGQANSAPRPSEAVAERLSERASRRGGSGRLFTRENINKASLPTAPGAAAPAQGPAQGPDRARPDRALQQPSPPNQGRGSQERANQDRGNQERANPVRGGGGRADQQRAEQQRQADEQRRIEQDRKVNEDRARADAERRQDQDRAAQQRGEQQRQADQQRQANEEKARQTEQRRVEDDRRRADQARQADQQRQANEDRARQNEQRQADQERANAPRRAEQQRAEQQRADQARQADAERRANEDRAREERGRATRAAPPSQSQDNPDRGKGRGDEGNKGRRGRD